MTAAGVDVGSKAAAWNLGSGYAAQICGVKRVYLLRDERVLPYLKLNFLVCIGVGRGRGARRALAPRILKFDIFLLIFELVKWNFTTVASPQKKCFWPPPEKIHYFTPGKNPRDDHARLCVDQGFSNFFAHVPLSIKYVISRHLIYADVSIQVYK